LVRQGLHGVRLVISDAHDGLRRALAEILAELMSSGAGYISCATLLQRVSRHAQAMVAALVRTIFAQPDHDAAQRQLEQVCGMLQRRFPQAVALLQAAAAEVLTYMRFPSEPWRQIHPTNPLERGNRELPRRCDVMGIFPHAAAVLRLVGALLEEVQDEWLVARRYFSRESMRKLLPSPVEDTMLAVPEKA
jgi:transposase-like protein